MARSSSDFIEAYSVVIGAKCQVDSCVQDAEELNI